MVDVLNFFVLAGILYSAIALIAPAEAAIKAAAAAAESALVLAATAAAAATTASEVTAAAVGVIPADISSSFYLAASSMLTALKIQLVLQLLMVVLPLFRFKYSGVASKEEVEAAQAKKKTE